MITMIEDTPKKITGITSIFIKIENVSKETLLNITGMIKEICDVYNYDKRTFLWEVPLINISTLIDFLSVFDDISIISQPENKNAVKSLVDPLKFKTKPFDYQIEGINYGVNHNKWLLLDDMGCIDGDAEVSVNYKLLKSSKYTSTKVMKLKKFYELFKNNKDVKFSIRSLNDEGWFGNVPVSNVIFSGVKDTYKLTLEDGRFVCATPDHLILTKNGYKRLDTLDIENDEVVCNGAPVCKCCGSSENVITDKNKKFVGYCRSCMYKHRNNHRRSGRIGIISEDDPDLYLGKDGYMRIYYTDVKKHPNYRTDGLCYHIYLMTKKIGRGLLPNECVHHIDDNKLNNDINNLQLLTISEHAKIHAQGKSNNLRRDFISGSKLVVVVPKYLKIKSIEPSGLKETYDVSVNSVGHNFIANKIVVHNCGKTLQSIYIAQYLYEQGKIEHCLILCGVDSLRSNWKKEIELHSNLSSMILGNRVTSRGTICYESVSYRAEQLKNKINEFFIITTLTTIRSDEVVNALNGGVNKIGLIIADEIHRCKDVNSIQGKQLLKLDAPYKMAMSGSLIVNDPLDCFVPLKWIGVEKSTLTNFKKFFCMWNDNIKRFDGYKNLSSLKEELESCSLRRLKDSILDLPKKNIINEFVDMNEDHKKLYFDVVNGIKDEIDKVKISSTNLLGLIVRLRQATSCPSVLTSKEIAPSKIIRCQELVSQLLYNNSDKVVIFTSFKDSVYEIERQLSDFVHISITGDTKDDITPLIDKFQNDNETRVLIATYQKLGTGVTLTRARYMIFIDCPWTSSDYTQACDRIYRVGTTKPVFIYNLICANTIDEKVNELINDKKALSDYMIDNKIEGNTALESLKKYIQEL